MKKTHYPQLNETLYRGQLPNGLQIAVLPRLGFQKKLCYLCVDFGSIHTDFTMDGIAHHAPAGVAHYLEHKLFDMPGRDISEEFAAMGASVNAFTSYDMTAYYFTCTENFSDCLGLLLEFVTTPYFTDESVAKEQGIIGQEIDMNLDSPDTQIFERLAQAMYTNHPIHIPILGTRESISAITPEILTQSHKAFYRPDNMLLCVIGDVDAHSVAEIAQAATATLPCPQVTVQRNWEEKMAVNAPFVSTQMEVAMPTFQLGFKCEPLDKGEEAVRREIIGDLAAEALFGESSGLYLQLYEEGMIDNSFGGGYDTVEGMSMLSASGDSDDPQSVMQAILEQAKVITAQGIGQENFLRMKRSAMGRRVRSLDSFDATCFRICAYHFTDFDYFRFPGVYETVTEEQVLDFIRQTVTEERACLSVIYPNEED